MRLATLQLLAVLGVQALTIPNPEASSRLTTRGTSDSIKIDELDVNYGKVIGDGLDGTVYEAKKKGKDEVYALKRYKGDLKLLQPEIDAYKAIDGKGVAPKFEAVVKGDTRDVGILIEKVDGKEPDLDDKDHAQGAAKALEKIHDQDRLHGDIEKKANILVRKAWGGLKTEVLLIDFARSTTTKDDAEKMIELSKLKGLFKGVKWNNKDDHEYEVADD